MEITLKRVNEAVHFEAVNSAGKKVSIDGSAAIGGENKGVRPMEMVIMGLGGCSSIDVGLILKKQKQHVEAYKLDIKAERYDELPKAFKSIDLHFHLWGDLQDQKVERAIDLTLTKYCPVVLSLSDKIKITSSFTIHHDKI